MELLVAAVPAGELDLIAATVFFSIPKGGGDEVNSYRGISS